MSSTEGQVPAWTVTRQEDTTIAAGARGAVRGKRIYYRLFDGSTGYVEIPLADFTAQRVKIAIDEQSIREMEVSALASDQLVETQGY